MAQIPPKQIQGVFGNQLLSNKLDGAVNPSVSNDITQGYYPGSIWINEVASPRRAYICLDNTASSAVWQEILLPVSSSQDPVGTVKEIYPFYPSWTSLPAEYAWMEGQAISDIDSPLNGFRVPNANGGTVTGVTITSLNNTLKTITVSTNDIWAFGIGDTLTFTGASVTNAVVRSIDYSTGVIEVGDVTLWSSGLFGLTTGTLTGATAVSSVGVPRYPKGGLVAGSGIDRLQGVGQEIKDRDFATSSYTTALDTGVPTGISNVSAVANSRGALQGTSNIYYNIGFGTPRVGQRTEPPFLNVRYAIIIK
jgi:hypothetical protein